MPELVLYGIRELALAIPRSTPRHRGGPLCHKGVPKDKLFSTAYSVSKMLEIIDKAGMEDTGRFIAWDGSDIQY